MKTNCVMPLYWYLPTNKTCPTPCLLPKSPKKWVSTSCACVSGIFKPLLRQLEMDCMKASIGSPQPSPKINPHHPSGLPCFLSLNPQAPKALELPQHKPI